MPRPPENTEKRALVSHAELKELLPCFFDIQMNSLLGILQMSSKNFAMVRHGTEVAKIWPFNMVKFGVYEMAWADIKQRRADALDSASPAMQTCLFMAEQKAVLMRALYMPKGQQHKVQAVYFPEMPADLVPNASIPNRPVDVAEEVQSYRRIPSLRRMEEIASILPCLIDLPIRVLSREVLGISHHTLLGVRKAVGLSEWPFEQVQRGGGHGVPTRQEVAELRVDTLMQLHPKSYKARVLLHARNMAKFYGPPVLELLPVLRQPVMPLPLLVEPPSPPEEPEVQYDEPLLSESLPVPAPSSTSDELWDFNWDDDDKETMSPEDLAYWRSLGDQ
jgi:hypothetical protein